MSERIHDVLSAGGKTLGLENTPANNQHHQSPRLDEVFDLV